MKVTSKINKTNLKILDSLMQTSFIKAVDAMKTDLINSQTMPFDTGEMQNRNTFLDDSKVKRGIVLIRTDTPYARRLYYHPEFNFQQYKNPNAGGLWFEVYINGNKKVFLNMSFAKILTKELKKHAT